MAHAFPLAPSADDDEATLQNFSQFPRNCFLFVCHRLGRELLRHPVCLSVSQSVSVSVALFVAALQATVLNGCNMSSGCLLPPLAPPSRTPFTARSASHDSPIMASDLSFATGCGAICMKNRQDANTFDFR